MADWPKIMQPVRPDRSGDALVLDPSQPPAEVFQLTAGGMEELVAWLTSNGFPPWATYEVNGGPVVILSNGGGAVGLGDFAAISGGRVIAHPAGGFYQRYQDDPTVEEPEPQ